MTEILPRLALSIRQPWAHAVAQGWKPIENRSWRVLNSLRNHRGPFCIHASKGMTRAEFDDAADTFEDLGFTCPPAAELQRGGIIGVATLVDIVKRHDSPWFFGPKGLVISDARPVAFVPVSGALDFFAWRPGNPAQCVPPPARWMLAAQAEPAVQLVDDRQGSLL